MTLTFFLFLKGDPNPLKKLSCDPSDCLINGKRVHGGLVPLGELFYRFKTFFFVPCEFIETTVSWDVYFFFPLVKKNLWELDLYIPDKYPPDRYKKKSTKQKKITGFITAIWQVIYFFKASNKLMIKPNLFF